MSAGGRAFSAFDVTVGAASEANWRVVAYLEEPDLQDLNRSWRHPGARLPERIERVGERLGLREGIFIVALGKVAQDETEGTLL